MSRSITRQRWAQRKIGLCAAVLMIGALLSVIAPSAQAATGQTGDRIGILDSGGTCWAKDGDLSGGWTAELGPNCLFITVSGTRIGVIDASHNCWVKDGDLGAGWVLQATGCSTLVLAGNTIAMQRNDGYCYAKQGDLYAALLGEYGPNCAAVSVSSSTSPSGVRIGVVDSGNGTCYAKQGLSSGWLGEYGPNCNGITVSNNRLGVRNTSGACIAKQGDLSAGWLMLLSGSCAWMQVTDTRVIAIQNGTCFLKDGDLSAGWLAERGPGCIQGSIDGDRIGTRDAATGHCYVKAGDPSSGWVDEFAGCQWVSVTSNVTWYPPVTPAPGRAAAVALARANDGGTACGPNTLGGHAFYTSCTGNGGQPEYWCADFLKWVWANSGFNVTGITAAARSVLDSYGSKLGTSHPAGYVPQPGDAIVYANHVQIVTSVATNGAIETENGDWGGTGSGEAAFSRSSHVRQVELPKGTTIGSTPSRVGQTVIGVVSPTY